VAVSGDAKRLINVNGEKLGYCPTFDGTRAIIVLIVVLDHAKLINKYMTGASIIVSWFFIASGFLITSLLLDETKRNDDINIRRFLTGRAYRLFPAMYAMLAVMTVILTVVQVVSPDTLSSVPYWWLEILSACFYVYFLCGMFLPGQVGVIGFTWSLAMQEQFYWLWPGVLRRTLRKRSRRSDRNLIIGMVAFIALFIAMRLGFSDVMTVNEHHGMDFSDQGDVTIQGALFRLACMRPDSLVFGCLLAIINKAIPRPIPEKLIQVTRYFAYAGWITLITFAFMGNRTPFFELFAGVPFQIAILMIGPIALDMYWRPKGWINRGLSIRPLRYMGIRSYGVYIWHAIVLLPFLTAINESTGMKKLVLGVLAAGLGYAAGPISYKYLETRFLKIRERRMGPKPDRAEPPVVIADQGPGEPAISITSPATVATNGSNGSDGPPEPELVANQSSIDGPLGPSSTTQDEG